MGPALFSMVGAAAVDGVLSAEAFVAGAFFSSARATQIRKTESRLKTGTAHFMAGLYGTKGLSVKAVLIVGNSGI